MTCSILLVDDSIVARAQVRAALDGKGARVIEAENGREGLMRARSTTVDLILTDVHMPQLDGLSMIVELRKLPQYATTPIFVLTSDAASFRIEEGKKIGVSAWIIKPVHPEHLWKAVDKALFGKLTRPSERQQTVDDASDVRK